MSAAAVIVMAGSVNLLNRRWLLPLTTTHSQHRRYSCGPAAFQVASGMYCPHATWGNKWVAPLTRMVWRSWCIRYAKSNLLVISMSCDIRNNRHHTSYIAIPIYLRMYVSHIAMHYPSLPTSLSG